MASSRRLAAIFAADVAGYSRLMQADEEGTLERFKAHLREVVEPKIREYHGRIVKTTGDGVLAEFASVVDAVRCAAEIQRVMADRDLDIVEERRLRFRIGVNLGDVIADGEDISATASTSPHGWRAWPRPVASASRARSATTSATGFPAPSTTWVSRASRTSRGRFGSTPYERKAQLARCRQMCRCRLLHIRRLALRRGCRLSCCRSPP
jgi:class 3 adenylate cyclase